MHTFRRALNGHSTAGTAAPPSPLVRDTNAAVLIASMICAVTCAMCLFLALRCAYLRRHFSAAPPPFPPPPPTTQQKEKTVLSLPSFSFTPGGDLSECPICLSDFVSGDQIRILPICAHGFHVACVDGWLSAHSTCPSCRRIL